MLQFVLKVVEITQETNETITICFKQPGLKKVKYLAGQYLTLIFKINNRKYLRPYSFSSAPGIDLTLNVTVKRIPGGVVSNHIANHLNVGDMVEVMEPMGSFTLKDHHVPDNGNLVFWGAGSGITPLFSMLKSALINNLAKHVILVYGNRNHEHTVFKQQILELQKQYPKKFLVWHFHTKFIADQVDSSILRGRIDPQKIIETVAEKDVLKEAYHFICGPNGFDETIKDALTKNGTLQERVFSESFELAPDPTDFEGIITQTIIITKAAEKFIVEVTKGKTILEAGLDAMIDLSYSCQTGTCLLCKAKLISGELKSIAKPTDQEKLNIDEHLLCCSLPLTNNVELLVY